MRDGARRPVAGAIVEADPEYGTTEANGHYDFRSTYQTAPGRVRPPNGYEPNPKRSIETFVIAAGTTDLVVRRITRVSIASPSTLIVGARENIGVEVAFDTGAVEYPDVDAFTLTSSNPAVLKAAGGAPAPFIEGATAGTAQVTGSYRGVVSPPVTVQVVAR